MPQTTQSPSTEPVSTQTLFQHLPTAEMMITAHKRMDKIREDESATVSILETLQKYYIVYHPQLLPDMERKLAYLPKHEAIDMMLFLLRLSFHADPETFGTAYNTTEADEMFFQARHGRYTAHLCKRQSDTHGPRLEILGIDIDPEQVDSEA